MLSGRGGIDGYSALWFSGRSRMVLSGSIRTSKIENNALYFNASHLRCDFSHCSLFLSENKLLLWQKRNRLHEFLFATSSRNKDRV